MHAMTIDHPHTDRIAVRTAEQLCAALDQIQVEGWDGQAGRAVLEYAREKIVRPAICSVGLLGSDAEQAEATGWAAAWEILRRRSLRRAASPWGVVSRGVRHAIVNERMADTYGTDEQTAWKIFRFANADRRRKRGDWKTVSDPSAVRRPVSLDALMEVGIEPVPMPSTARPRLRLAPIVALLVRHGWDPDTANHAVLHIADHARPNPTGGPRAHGWPEMALDLGIPGWQARRVTFLLLGSGTWPGLVEQLARGGEEALCGPAIDAAVRATVDPRMRPPAPSARMASSTACQSALAS